MKSDIERRPFGAWAYNTRDRLDLSVEAVAADLDYHPAALRKMEAGAEGTPSRKMRRLLEEYYPRKARERNVRIDLPPAIGEEVPDDADVAAAIREQTEVMRELVQELRASRSELIAPETLTLFLRQLRSEGWLTVPETASSSDAVPQPAEAIQG